jgi:hypothetical protein
MSRWPLLGALVATALAGLLAGPARAQSIGNVVTTCASSSLTAGQPTALYVDVYGNLCNRGAVYGPQAAGVNASYPPVLFAGTTSGAGTGPIQVPLINSSGELSVFLDPISINWLSMIYSASTAPLPAQSGLGVKIGAIEGVSAPGTSASEYPLSTGGTASTAAPTVVAANGQKVAAQYDPTGKAVTMPYAAPWAQLRGSVSTSSASGNVTGMGMQGVGAYVHVVSCQAFRGDTGTAAITLTLDDTASTVIGLPNAGNGGGNNPRFEPPLVLAANTGLSFTVSTATPSVYLSCQGFVSGTP